MTTTPAVRLHAVTKHFRKVSAVNGIDLEIGRGETVALLGPNGAGKSTTINLMLGLVSPDAGRAELFGRPPQHAVSEGLVGAMLQDDMYLPNASVRDFVTLAHKLFPRSTRSVDEILSLTGLTDRASARLNKLSGGEAKRTRFAFALAGDPELLVLDEPTASMDVVGRQAFWLAMRRYAEAGNAIIFATHYLEEADDFADRIVVIDGGRIVADGTAAEIKGLASGRTVAFDLLDDHGGLDALPGVRHVDIRAGRAYLVADDSDRLVTELVRGGRAFRNLEVVPAGLETAFLALTAPAAVETVEV